MFVLTAHPLVTLAKLARPGGIRVAAAESLAVKHQLLIMKRSRQRCGWSKLNPRGFVAGFGGLETACDAYFPCSADRTPSYVEKIPCSFKIIPCSVE
jgi:hypothetical protein